MQPCCGGAFAGGGPSNVTINDTSLSLNGGTGVNGVSGPSGNVNIDLTRAGFTENQARLLICGSNARSP